MNEADYGITDMAMSNGRYQGDESLLVKFFKHPLLNQIKSEEQGRPIYEETPYIQIMQPGNKDSIVVRPASDMDKNRFAEHYRKFEAREDQDSIEGTLLEEWAAVTRSQVEELRYLNIRTVEQLATVSDSNAQNVMGINLLREKAKKFLETSEKEATAERFAELEAKYQALLESQGVEAPKKRGRPKKEESEQAA